MTQFLLLKEQRAESDPLLIYLLFSALKLTVASSRLPTEVLEVSTQLCCVHHWCVSVIVSENSFTENQSPKSSDRAVSEVSRYADVKGGGGKGQGTTCQRAVV